ncbi:MAG: hypothetical protein ACO3O5_07540 [Burkholderiaceae bacterium]
MTAGSGPNLEDAPSGASMDAGANPLSLQETENAGPAPAGAARAGLPVLPDGLRVGSSGG